MNAALSLCVYLLLCMCVSSYICLYLPILVCLCCVRALALFIYLLRHYYNPSLIFFSLSYLSSFLFLSSPLLFSSLLSSFSPLQYFFSLFHFSLSSIIYFRNIVRSKSGIFACPKSVINSHLVTDKKVKIKERIFSIFVSVL